MSSKQIVNAPNPYWIIHTVKYYNYHFRIWNCMWFCKHLSVFLPRIFLMEIRHPQSTAPIEIDNTAVVGVLMKHLSPFSFYCRNNQDQINAHWNKGTTNLADYFVKFHPSHHHRDIKKLHDLKFTLPNRYDIAQK